MRTAKTRNEPADSVTLAEQMWAVCSVITKVARADLEARLKQHDSGFSAIEHGVLRHLSRGVTSMAEICRLMGVAPSTLVYVVDELTRRKLVRRSADPNDRRKEPLLLEAKGAELFAKTPKMDSASILVRSLERMPAPRRQRLMTLLYEFVEQLNGSERMYLGSEPAEPAAKTGAEKTTRARKEKKR